MARTEVRLSQVILADDQDSQILELREVDGPEGDAPRTLTLLIGRNLAQVIANRVRGESAPRPLTHDLTLELARVLGGRVEEVEIVGLEEGVYHARLRVRQGEEVHELDARPSDAVALAIGSGARLWVADAVWARVA